MGGCVLGSEVGDRGGEEWEKKRKPKTKTTGNVEVCVCVSGGGGGRGGHVRYIQRKKDIKESRHKKECLL